MRWLVVSLLALCSVDIAWTEDIDFARDVLPILSENCFQCHGPDARARKGDLRLDTKEGALRKDEPVIIVGKSGDSELIRRLLTREATEVMPPPETKKSLTQKQKDVLRTWIDQGAKWGKHWAFEPIRKPAIPRMDGQIQLNPIDAFVQTRLARESLKPSPRASKESLIRRVTLDLTGLPPTLEEVDNFLKDTSTAAYEKLVDRLLATPRYGERMVWDWLDAARYADSNGYQGDGERTMWPWRDWAVQALNRDMPFDQFTIWQLAGDLLPNATQEQKLATGFLRNHMINGEGGRIPEENRIDYVMDMTETTATVWLGLTFNCCRCHDHKYDPLTQKEYYGLFAFFNQTPVNGSGGNPQTPPVLEMRTPAEEKKLHELGEELKRFVGQLEEVETKLFPRDKGKPASDAAAAKDLPQPIKDILKQRITQRNRNQIGQLEKQFTSSQADYAGLLKAYGTLLGQRDDITKRVVRVMIMEDMPKQRDTFLLEKGLYNKPGPKVDFAFPQILGTLPTNAPKNRLTLAKWLVSAENPLTARVVANRIWQLFFGYGLVKTVEDFGVQGERPVNPELLDWLAADFRENGWSLKKLIRQIVTSSTYQQASIASPTLLEKDPENRLLARGPRFRMPAWMIRDQALAASGLLVGTIGGPPVNGYQPAGIWEETTFGTKKYTQDHGDALYRRSMYIFWRRIVAPTVFFDAASRQTCTVKQTRTNTPLQALLTLNDVTYVEAARHLAERVLLAEGTSDTTRLAIAMRRVLARTPAAAEREILLRGLERLRKQYQADPEAAKKLLAIGESKCNEKPNAVEHAAWTGLCNIILNLDETLTKE